MQYKINGSLYQGVPWEDFASHNGPYVTIVAMGQPDADEIPVGKQFVINKSEDGWYDATVHELTDETAKKVLAEINNVNSAEIEIIEGHVCASI